METHIVPPKLRRVLTDAVLHGKALGVVGLYGAGKALVADWLAADVMEKHTAVVRLSLKDMPEPNHREILEMFQHAVSIQLDVSLQTQAESDFDLHYFLQSAARSVHDKHIVFILEEAHLLSHMPESFFDALESLRYRNAPRVTFVLFGQPQLRDCTNAGFLRFVQAPFEYLGNLSKRAMPEVLRLEEKRLDVSFRQYETQLYRLSGGHYGTIKYINQLLKKHRFAGERLFEAKVIGWAQKEQNFQFFLRLVWRSIRNEERTLLSVFFQSKTLPKKYNRGNAYDELIRLGLLRKHGARIQFVVPMLTDSLLQLTRKNEKIRCDEDLQAAIILDGDALKIHGNSVDTWFTYQEQRVLAKLVKHKAETVSYEMIGIVLWGDNSDRFSLWNIAKIIQRLRKKLRQMGIPPKTIRNVSGKGYLFVN